MTEVRKTHQEVVLHAAQFAPASQRSGYQTMSSYFGAPISAMRNHATQRFSKARAVDDCGSCPRPRIAP